MVSGRVVVPKFWPVGKDATSEEIAESNADPVKISSGPVADGVEVRLSGTVAGRAVGIDDERAAMDGKISVVTLTVAVVVQVLALLWQLFSQYYPTYEHATGGKIYLSSCPTAKAARPPARATRTERGYIVLALDAWLGFL